MATVSIPVTPSGPAQGTRPGAAHANPQTMLDDIAEQVRMLREEIRTISQVVIATHAPPAAPEPQDSPGESSEPASTPPQGARGATPRLRGEAWELSVKRQFTGSRLA